MALPPLRGDVPRSDRSSEEASEPTAWPLRNPAGYTLLWVVIIIAIFAPLSVRQYKRAARR